MHHERFNEIVDSRLGACRELLVPKGEEYARNGDRLHNFKTAARVKGETPEMALFGMYAKHLVSVMDLVEDVAAGTLPSEAILAEKINDSINYHLLLEGLIRERMERGDDCSDCRLDIFQKVSSAMSPAEFGMD